MNFGGDGQIGKSLKSIPEKATAWCNNYLKPVMVHRKASGEQGDSVALPSCFLTSRSEGNIAVLEETRSCHNETNSSHDAARSSSNANDEHGIEQTAASTEGEGSNQQGESDC